ncbi:MAG: BrnA antitoxin family protein [Blastocatellia bacterium]|nr:BrnA antitoxin family protein [Blastocatellia bacterium]
MKKGNNAIDPLAKERDLTGKKIVRRRDAGKVVSSEALDPRNIKVQISIKIDADILEYFKERAQKPETPPYQTLINEALRDHMEQDRGGFPGEALVHDDRFVDAITERIKQRL